MRILVDDGDEIHSPIPFSFCLFVSALAVKEYLLTRDDIELESLLAQCAAYIASTLTEGTCKRNLNR